MCLLAPASQTFATLPSHRLDPPRPRREPHTVFPGIP
jgi:hypothetical protein